MDSTLTAVLYPALNRAADENRFVIPVDGWLRVRAKSYIGYLTATGLHRFTSRSATVRCKLACASLIPWL